MSGGSGAAVLPGRRLAPRDLAVRLHRWTGLTLLVFLLVTAGTGSLLAFSDDLQDWLAPGLHLAAPPPGDPHAVLLDVHTLRERAEQATALRIENLPLRPEPGRALRMEVVAPPGAAAPGYDEIFVNPYTGEVQGRRRWADFAWNAETLMPLIYRLHHSLGVDGIGRPVVGALALLWLFDCVLGAYLTLPRRPPVFPKWRAAWRIKWRAGSGRFWFDLHRAAGLWLWGVLLLYAWTGVGFNLYQQVYRPVMGVFLSFNPALESLAPRPVPLDRPELGWRRAHARARAAMGELARQQGFTVDAEVNLWLDRRGGVYVYTVHSSLDVRNKGGSTSLVIDADDGRVLAHHLPSGAYGGDQVNEWLAALHMAQVFGQPYRAAVGAAGVVIVLFSVAGAVVWLRKRRAQRRPTAIRR